MQLDLKALALIQLAGVGDKTLGQWHEWTGRAYHVRRRLSEEEQRFVGLAIDCRGTEEWQIRYDRAKEDTGHIPVAMFAQMAEEEKDP